MERLRQRPARRERTGIIQIILIAGILAAALYGGLRLLGETHAKFNQRQEEKASHARAVQSAAARDELDRIAYQRYLHQTAKMERAAEQRRLFESGQFKCVGGTVFRKLSNGWENVQGARCPTATTD